MARLCYRAISFENAEKMKQIIIKQALQAAGLVLLMTALSSHAEIYKWVDADGKVHYSEKKDGAGKAKVEEVKVQASDPVSNQQPQTWQDRELEYRKRQMSKKPEPAYVPEKPKPKPIYGKDPETDESRCLLGKAVLAGRVRHSNGAKIDENDKNIAQRDVSSYCH